MRLPRDTEKPDCTFGTFLNDDGTAQCEILEPPKEHPLPNRRRLPAGDYTVKLRFSHSHGHAVYGYLTGPGTPAPDFSDVEIHSGNTVLNSLACQLPGKRRGTLRVDERGVPSDTGTEMDAVLDSRDALDDLMKVCGCPDYEKLTTPQLVAAWMDEHPLESSFHVAITDPPAILA